MARPGWAKETPLPRTRRGLEALATLPRAGVLFAAMFACLSLNAFKYLLHGARAHRFTLALTLALAGLCGLFVRSLARAPTPSQPTPQPRVAVVLSTLLAAGYWSVYAFLTHGGNEGSVEGASLALGSAVVLLASLALPLGPRAFGALLAGLFGIHLAVMIHTVPLEQSGGDMLVLIQGGVDRALAGQFPYVDLREYDSATLRYSDRPLTYPPVLWLAYLPLRAVGLDLRWLSVLAMAGLAVLLLRPLRTSRATPEYEALLPLVSVSLFAAPFLLLCARAVQVPIFWLLLALIVRGVAERWSPLRMGALCALALGMRETMVLAVPLLALHYARQERGALRGFATALGAGVLLIYGPVLLIDAKAFGSCMLYNAAYTAAEEYQSARRQLGHVGLGGWFFALGMPGLIRVAQLAVAAVVLVHAWRTMRTPAQTLWSFGVLYFAFILLNSIVYEYYYVAPLLVLGLQLLQRAGQRAHEATAAGEQERRVEAGVSAA